eukprot:g25157.t1
MFGLLDSGEGEGKWAGVAPLPVTGEGAVGLWRGIGGEGSVDKGVVEGMFPVEGRQEWEREYVSGDGNSLEVAEMVSDDLLDVDADGMVVWRYSLNKYGFILTLTLTLILTLTLTLTL